MSLASSSNSASTSRPNSTADSYIGSLISLTSKSEIRYEGVLYNINTEESSIGLKNVRSFGTEGRKRDGPQIPPSDRVYEYILFRGSDIKDLQVKSSPQVQEMPPINNDPAIIQSHYPHPVSMPTSLPSAVSGSLTDLGSHNAQMGHPGSNFQGGVPLYQSGGSLGSWGASPPLPSANGSGLAMPMYWQGYYGPPNGLSPLPQQSLLRPPPGLSMPPSMQQPVQYPNFNASLPRGTLNLPGSNLPVSSLPASLPDIPSPLVPTSTNSLDLNPPTEPTTLPSSLPLAPSTVGSKTLPILVPGKAASSALSAANLSATVPSVSPLTTYSTELNTSIPPISNKPNSISGALPTYQHIAQPTLSVVESNSLKTETPTPSLVTPGQLLQSGPTLVPSSEPVQTAHKDVEVVQISSSPPPPPESSVPVATDARPPILPLPVPSRATHKPNGGPFYARHGYWGRERGRGTGGSCSVTNFNEEFDFMAMNEKFNKDEVWGHLGKSNKSHSKDKGDGKVSDEYDSEDEDDELVKMEIKPVYKKDDFFDTISCNALEYESQNGRARFSEQMKIDTETFGDFPRYRGGRGGRGPPRGGGRSRGSYYGRGYGYGYVGRGRGRFMPSHAS